MGTAADTRECRPQRLAGMRPWMAGGHGGTQVEQCLDPVLARGALIASHEVGESVAVAGVVEDAKQLERSSLWPNPHTNPVADHETAAGLGHQLQADRMQSAVDLGDGGARAFQGPAHPCRDRRRRGRLTQADDKGPAETHIIGKRARRRLVDTRHRTQQGGESPADGDAAGRWGASGSPAHLRHAEVSLA